jgi:hypothetical protein
MKTRINRRDLARVGIFVSVLMVLFGFGNCVATADLFAGDPRFDQHAVTRMAGTWSFVGVSGLLLLVSSIVLFRKYRGQE